MKGEISMQRITEDEFFSRHYLKLSPVSKEYQKMAGIFNAMQEKLEGRNPEDEISKEELKTFFVYQINSRTVLSTQRGLLVHILEDEGWNPKTISNLKSIEYSDVNVIPLCELEYWGSVESLHEAINEIGYIAGRKMWYQNAVAGLLWSGIKMSDIVELTMEDIDFDRGEIRLEGKYYFPDIATMIAAQEHKSSCRNPSIYLFQGHHGVKASDGTLRKNMAWLNEFEDKIGKRFDGRKILMSGMFDRIWKGLEDEPVYQKDIMYKYHEWLNAYHPGDIDNKK